MVTWGIHYPAIPDDERSLPDAGRCPLQRVAGDRPGAGFLHPVREIRLVVDGPRAKGAESAAGAGAGQPAKKQRADLVRARSNRQNGLFLAAGG